MYSLINPAKCDGYRTQNLTVPAEQHPALWQHAIMFPLTDQRPSFKKKEKGTVWQGQAVTVPNRDVHHPGGSQLLNEFGSECCGLGRTTSQASATAPSVHLKNKRQESPLADDSCCSHCKSPPPDKNCADEKIVRWYFQCFVKKKSIKSPDLITVQTKIATLHFFPQQPTVFNNNAGMKSGPVRWRLRQEMTGFLHTLSWWTSLAGPPLLLACRLG